MMKVPHDHLPAKHGRVKTSRHVHQTCTWLLALAALCLLLPGEMACQWKKEQKMIDAPILERDTPYPPASTGQQDDRHETPAPRAGRENPREQKKLPTRGKSPGEPGRGKSRNAPRESRKITTEPQTRAPSVDHQHSTWVYICDSPSSSRYHKYSTCRGLARCSKEIKRVSKQDAITTSNLTPCKLCYHAL
jgi:hypothetical protein